MGPLPYVRWNQGLPERFAWGAASIGIIGLLLVSLIIWVERLETKTPGVETGPPVQEAVPCNVEPAGRRSGVSGVEGGTDYPYAVDIGDNGAVRSSVTLRRIPVW